MKDEIKEILDDLRTYKDRYEYFLFNNLSFSDRDYKAKILLDYITNLQEEKIQLEGKVKQLEHNCKQAENSCRQHRLASKNHIRRLKRREKQINIYKSRNEKAIYDLEKTKELNDRHILARDNIVIHLDIDHIEYLLNILKGDNK